MTGRKITLAERMLVQGIEPHVARNAQDMANTLQVPVWVVTSAQGLQLQAFPVDRTDEIRAGAEALAVFTPEARS
jgi:hypothetical protein